MPSQAVEFEIKQKFKQRDSITLRTFSEEKGELSSKRKNRIGSKTRLLAKFSPDIEGLTPYVQLGYEWQKSAVEQNISINDNALDLINESYDETVTTSYLGVGLKYKLKDFLAADKIKFELRYDYWFDVKVDRSGLAEGADKLSGNYTGYEAKLKIEARYASPFESFIFQPQFAYSYENVDAWLNDFDLEDNQFSVTSHELELRFLGTWLLEDSSVELSVGPEIVYGKEREVDGAITLEAESEQITLLTFLGSYEIERYDIDMEFWFWRQVSGELKGENNFEFKINWSF